MREQIEKAIRRKLIILNLKEIKPTVDRIMGIIEDNETIKENLTRASAPLRGNKRCFAPCENGKVESGQCSCHNAVMDKVSSKDIYPKYPKMVDKEFWNLL